MNSNIITLLKINDVKVKPIPNPELQNRKIKAEYLFKDPYCNIFMCAKKKSGKTSVVNKIVTKCAGKDTNIVVFCSSLNKDHNYSWMKRYFKNKGNPFVGYTSLKDGGEDRLDALVNHIQAEADAREKQAEAEEDEKELPKPQQLLLFNDSDEEQPEKKRKSKYLAPEWIIILDDLSSELKSKSLVSLLKMNRHFRAKIIISSQYLNDLLPESRKQIDYWLIFRGQPDDKLAIIHKDADLSIDFELFKSIYLKATEQEYSFLYIDAQTEQFRRNFDTVFNIPNKI